MSSIMTIYLGIVLTVGLVATLRVWFWLRALSLRRLLRVQRRQQLASLPRQPPVPGVEGQARARAEEAVHRQFSVHRNTLIPILLVFTGLLAAVPFATAIPSAVLSLLIAGVTVAISIAARPVMENLAAGLLLSASRVVNIGDTVEVAGVYGSVEDIGSTHTIIKRWNWQRFVVPNAKMLSMEVLNYSVVDRFTWAHVEFHVAPSADLAVVEQVACEAARSSKHAFNDEAPVFWIMDLGPNSVRCWVAAWAATPSDAWMVKHDTRTALATELQARGIAMQTQWVTVSGEAREGLPPGPVGDVATPDLG